MATKKNLKASAVKGSLLSIIGFLITTIGVYIATRDWWYLFKGI